MSKPTLSLLAGILLLTTIPARSENLNLSEKPDTVRVSLSPYSWGLGIGDVSAMNSALKKESDQFLKLSVVQAVIFAEHWNVGLDLDWFAPGTNLGGDLSLDYLAGIGSFKPFVGAGAGVHYFDTGANFGKGIGPSGTVHVGFLMDVLDELQLRVRVPFHFVANAASDRGVGLDLALLFSGPHRNTMVKQLKY